MSDNDDRKQLEQCRTERAQIEQVLDQCGLRMWLTCTPPNTWQGTIGIVDRSREDAWHAGAIARDSTWESGPQEGGVSVHRFKPDPTPEELAAWLIAEDALIADIEAGNAAKREGRKPTSTPKED